MDDFYSREFTLADMPFLMHEFENSIRFGLFSNDVWCQLFTENDDIVLLKKFD